MKILILIIFSLILIQNAFAQYTGGNADGFDYKIFSPPLAQFLGGSGDGFDSKTFTQLPVQYLGGYADGFAYYSFVTTQQIPTVTTSAVSNVSQTTVNCGGNISSAGSGTITARGVCWNTTGSPTTADAHTSDGSSSGTFTSAITGLNCNTLYHLRAYASNNFGTSYGGEQTFTSLPPVSKNVNLSIYLHGLWNGTTHKYAPICVELRQGTSLMSSTITAREECGISSNANITINFSEVPDGSYYVVVRAAGYLPVAMPSQITLPSCEGLSHNFTTSDAQSVSGQNVMIYSNGVYQVRAGDFNGDVWISTVDLNTYFKASYGRQARSSIPAE
ncbi:MAG: large repetitive protein [Bacteroidota bacterium]|nr:large repetitive protein [Bacteroidota bacterium]